MLNKLTLDSFYISDYIVVLSYGASLIKTKKLYLWCGLNFATPTSQNGIFVNLAPGLNTRPGFMAKNSLWPIVFPTT
jgi:hypothetical protein